MGKKSKIPRNPSKTLPSSPTHSSSSSSDFEFRTTLSPRKSSAAALCPADELFYKGQLLPLHLSPRISMLRTLLLASSSTSSSSATASARDSSSSTDSSSSSLLAADLSLLASHSSRPSSVSDDDLSPAAAKPKYFSFSTIFKKNPPKSTPGADGPSVKKSTTSSAKDVIRKYLKKVKPLYDKLRHQRTTSLTAEQGNSDLENKETVAAKNLNFSGNLKCGGIIKRRYVASCPSSMRSSPSHSGLLSRAGLPVRPGTGFGSYSSETSTMEELQNAIQGAIAHCKNSMIQQNTSSFNNKGKAIEIA